MTTLTFESRNPNILTRTVDSSAVANPGGIDYLLQYGFDQSIQDSIAGLMVKCKLELQPEGQAYVLQHTTKGMSQGERKALHTEAGQKFGYKYFTNDSMELVREGDFADEKYSEEDLTKTLQEHLYDMERIFAVINEATLDRQEQILTGTVAIRAASATPKLDPITRRMKELALSEVQKRIKARAVADPTAPTIPESDIAGYVELYFTKNYERLNDEAQKFFNPAAAAKTISLADLFEEGEGKSVTETESESEATLKKKRPAKPAVA